MRILLIAYEYPPIIAAQSLRWFYLVNELARLGVEVHVLCPEFSVLPAFPVPNHAGVIEHRCWPGPVIGVSQWLSRHQQAETAATVAPVLPRDEHSMRTRVAIGVRSLLDAVLYPDMRTEWYPFARRRLKALLSGHAFDAVISSHEPGVDLLLGLWAKKRVGVRWIVDLADPLCAPYSPHWRRRLDKWVENRVIQQADRVIITTDRLCGLLKDRHGLANCDRFACIPQGAPAHLGLPASGLLTPGKMNIVFTGNFYEKFRNPGQFAEALRRLASPDVAVTIVGNNSSFKALFEGIENVNFIGRIGHFECLGLQQEADVLLNIGNAQAYQMPGKVYEYLGAMKPILHLRGSRDDPSETLLMETGLGVVVDNDREAIEQALVPLLEAWRSSRPVMSNEQANVRIAAHTWQARANQLFELIAGLQSAGKPA